MHNLDKEEPEGGAGSPGGTYSLRDQGEEPSHTCFKSFSYLIHSCRSLLDNKPPIEYLNGTMPGSNDTIRARRPSLVDWEVIHKIVTRMKRIVGSIVLSQCSSKEWLLSEAIMDMLWIYTYFSGDDADDDVLKHLDKWWKREAIQKMRRTCTVNYLR